MRGWDGKEAAWFRGCPGNFPEAETLWTLDISRKTTYKNRMKPLALCLEAPLPCPPHLISSPVICARGILKKYSRKKGSAFLIGHRPSPPPLPSQMRKLNPEEWAHLPFTMAAKCTGLEKVPCRLRSPQVHLAGVTSLLKRLESLGDAALTGPIIGILPCLGLCAKRLKQ